MFFNDEKDVEWHRRTEGHVWNKLRAETNNNYVYISNSAKTKIPENARCDICRELAHLKRLRVNGKRVPDWYVLDKEKMIVRCRKCKKEQLNLMKSQFAKLVRLDTL
jgi:hypothetical protein